MKPLADDVWVLRHKLALLGADLGRNVTILRVGGQVLVHSTAPFTAAEVSAIRELGKVAWLVEATCMHDTYTLQGRAAFPEAECYVPPGFPETGGGVAPKSLTEPPPEWEGIVDLLELEGLPRLREFALLHRPSRTLVVADAVFNVSPEAGGWLRFLLKTFSGLQGGPGISRLFLSMIKDRAAFAQSLERLLTWDFDRVIVGHGDAIPHDGKAVLRAIFQKHGLLKESGN